MKINKKSLSGLRSLINRDNTPTSSTMRKVGEQEIKTLIKTLKKAKKRVRIYSSEGFVPNSYKWPCRIEYIEAIISAGEWHLKKGHTSAQRSYGQGNLLVIQ